VLGSLGILTNIRLGFKFKIIGNYETREKFLYEQLGDVYRCSVLQCLMLSVLLELPTNIRLSFIR
jgi:hypothetical protein